MTDLRQKALDLFQIALTAADPKQAVKRGLQDHPCQIDPAGQYHLIAVGKAAVPMATQALELLDGQAGARRGSVLAVTNYENVPARADFPIMGAGHPLPDAQGIEAAQAVISLLTTAVAPQDTVIVLLSGGGSALLPAPAGDITLDEKRQVTDQLLKSGADIGQINTVRRALSQLKGGGLAALCPDVPLYAYILSDVPSDHLPDIASGPTVLGSTDLHAARAILTDYHLYDQAPASVKAVLEAEEVAPSRTAPLENHLIGSNRLSVDAMAAALGSTPYTRVSDWLEGPVEEAAALFVDRIDHAQTHQGIQAFICGGETAVTVRGTGRGGRNQEMALRVANLAHARGLTGRWVFLSGGTDGRDGPTDAAGGIVDAQTIPRLQEKPLEVSAYLDNNDSYAALEESGDLIITGGTGTNVADVQICLVAGEERVS